MKRVTAALFCLGLLAACTNTTPVAVESNSPHLLHGMFVGQARELLPSGEAPPIALNVQSSAQMVTDTRFTVTGSLSLKGQSYSLAGEGEGFDGATIRTQTSPLPAPRFSWTAALSLDGVQVGIVHGTTYPHQGLTHHGLISFGKDIQRYAIELWPSR